MEWRRKKRRTRKINKAAELEENDMYSKEGKLMEIEHRKSKNGKI